MGKDGVAPPPWPSIVTLTTPEFEEVYDVYPTHSSVIHYITENSASKTNKSKARSVTTLMKKAVLDDTTAADHDTDGDDVTGVDLSQPQPEDSSSQNEQEEITSQTEVEKTKYDPDNPDPDVSDSGSKSDSTIYILAFILH